MSNEPPFNCQRCGTEYRTERWLWCPKCGADPEPPIEPPSDSPTDDGRCPHCGALMLVGWQPCRPAPVVREWLAGDTRDR